MCFVGTKISINFKFNSDKLRLRADNEEKGYKLVVKAANLYVKRYILRDELSLDITNRLVNGELINVDFCQANLIGPFQFYNASEFNQQVRKFAKTL